MLACNGGLSNSDVASLPLSAIDVDRAWIDCPWPKTGIERRFPLCPDTIEALRATIASRPTPKKPKHDDLAFITKYGGRWGKDDDREITKEFRKLLDEHNAHWPGLGFYALRHTFETIGGESRDQVAVDCIMDHARDDMASVFLERISDERLHAAAERVRGWLEPHLAMVANVEER